MVENCGLVDVSWETVASSRGGLKEGSQMVGHEMASFCEGKGRAGVGHEMASLDNSNSAAGGNVDWIGARCLSYGWRGCTTAIMRTKKPHSNCFK